MAFFKFKRHSQLVGADMSTLVWQHVDDNAGLLALTVEQEDLGKVVQQDDTSQLWFLARVSPTVVWIDLTAEASASPIAVFDEGVEITNDVASTAGLNFVGDGVVVQLSGGFTQVAIPGGGGAGSTFLALSDTPASYGGNKTFIVRVNDAEDALEFVELTSQIVKIAATPGAENTTLAQNSSLLFSAGVYEWDGLANLAGGTFDVGAGQGLIRSGPLDTDPILATKWDALTGITLPDQELHFIWVNYNAGLPVVQTGPVRPTNFNENIILGTIARDDTVYHPTPSLVVTADAFARLSKRFFDTQLVTHAFGAAITEEVSVPLTFSYTAAEWWIALVEIDTVAKDMSGTDRFFYYWRDGSGGWNITSGNQQIDNQRYDDGLGVLATLASNTRRGVHWVYAGVDDHTYVLYGRGNYTASQAQDAQAPADLPSTFQKGHAALVGKIVVQKNQTTFESVESPFTEKLSVGAVTEHNDLGGLATGDDHPQYMRKDTDLASQANSDDATGIQLPYSQTDGSVIWGDAPSSLSSLGQWKYQGVQSSDVDPGTANFKVNDADHTLVTKVWASWENKNGINYDGILSLTPGDKLIATQGSNQSRSVIYTVDAISTDLGDYFSFPVSYAQETADFSGFTSNFYDITFTPGAPAARVQIFGATPAIGDDITLGFGVGDIAIVGITDAYICLDNAVGAAVWKKITP